MRSRMTTIVREGSKTLRSRIAMVAVLAFAGFYLLRLGTVSGLSGGWQAMALLGGLVLFVGATWWLRRDYDPQADEPVIQSPSLARFLFDSPRSAPLWLGARVYLGYEWFNAGFHKITDPAWMAGGKLQGYWAHAVALPAEGRPAISYDWYRSALQGLLEGGHQSWFAPLIAAGELLVGVGLIVGALVGVAAFFGAVMNMSFMLAGSASTNPILFSLAIGMMLAWKVAGYIGVDRVLLPLLGAPWSKGTLFTQPVLKPVPLS